MNSFLLITNRAEKIDGSWESAFNMANRRLNSHVWELYENTPHKKELKTGDLVIVYLAGPEKGAMSFIGQAEILKIDNSPRACFDFERANQDTLTAPPVAIITLHQIKFYKTPIKIHEIKDSLDFIPKTTNKWGCVLQRGVKKLSAKDAHKISSWSSDKLHFKS